MSLFKCKVWYLKWKLLVWAEKLPTQIFYFWNFITSLSLLKLGVSYPCYSRFLFNLHLLALWLIFCQFFILSESSLNFLLDKDLTCEHSSMGIEVMSVWKKLLANARICSSRVWHHHLTSKQILLPFYIRFNCWLINNA